MVASPAISSTQSRRSARRRALDAVEPGEEGDVLVDREIAVEGEELRHVADVALDRLGLGAQVEARHLPRRPTWAARDR